MLSTEHKRDWDEKGFFIIRGFMPIADCRAMHARVIEISRLSAAGQRVPNVFVVPEKKPNPLARNPEDSVGKIFRLHRDPIFKKLVEDPAVIGPDAARRPAGVPQSSDASIDRQHVRRHSRRDGVALHEVGNDRSDQGEVRASEPLARFYEDRAARRC